MLELLFQLLNGIGRDTSFETAAALKYGKPKDGSLESRVQWVQSLPETLRTHIITKLNEITPMPKMLGIPEFDHGLLALKYEHHKADIHKFIARYEKKQSK